MTTAKVYAKTKLDLDTYEEVWDGMQLDGNVLDVQEWLRAQGEDVPGTCWALWEGAFNHVWCFCDALVRLSWAYEDAGYTTRECGDEAA